MKTLLIALATVAAAAGGHALIPAPASPPSPEPTPRLVVHEWGTFTSFSGSDGVPVGFRPNNTDLPSFVYYPIDTESKAGRLLRDGIVSMETPVAYFYTDRETRASVTVDFPRGWITEWYPFAAAAPGKAARNERTGGQSIRWDLKLTPGAAERFPRDKGDRASENPYYEARETAAVPLQVTAPARTNGQRGVTEVQQEKFLFYRGVGTFPPPVTVRALGGNRVRVVNSAGGTVGGLVLLTVRDGKLGFRALPDLPAGEEADATLPELGAKVTDLADHVAKALTVAGLYEKEARAMVNTWDAAWFREEGTRLLYLVPRARTDELLPIKIDPKPAEVVRVLVGRHDFVTPEQEAEAERQVARVRAAQRELEAAQKELARLGRFSPEAQRLAAARLDKANRR